MGAHDLYLGDLVDSPSTSGPHTTRSRTNGNGARTVTNVHAMECKPSSLIVADCAVSSHIVKRLDEPVDNQLEDDPRRKSETISRAANAASRPLLVSSGIDRSTA